MSSSSRSSTPSLSSDDSDLPSASYDGGHLPWRAFRQEVLAPHQIRILDIPPKDRIPASFLQIVEAASQDISRFDDQKSSFWTQVTTGRGFGPSPIFPPNLLPPLASEQLSRCMVPSFGSREALPERAFNHVTPLYELSLPHPGLGCGFSAAAFTNRELANLPQWLQATGTIVHWETGYISPSSTTYCPFLTFERAYGNKEHRVESANNQCAIAGAYSLRALQMLYARGLQLSDGDQVAALPITFSCTIDNSFALLNLHWLDFTNGQTYCMAPLCQFDLSKDVHFSKFLVWTQAISEWALTNILPRAKEALGRLNRSMSPVTPAAFYPIRRANTMPPTKLRLDTGPALMKDELLISSLKTAFEEVPWRFDNDEDSGVSSSTASWGSPMVSDLTFSNLNYPTVHPPRSNISATKSSVGARKRLARVDASRSPLPPPPAYLQNQDMLWQKRFNHAMDEIKELQTQLQAFQGEVECLKTSLRGKVEEKSTLGVSEAPPKGGGDAAAPVDLTPMTPRAPVSYASVIGIKPSAWSSKTLEATSSIWKRVASAFSEHVLSQSGPNKVARLLAYGCVTTVCILAIVRPTAYRNSALGALVTAKAGFLGLWKR